MVDGSGLIDLGGDVLLNRPSTINDQPSTTSSVLDGI
jgi:hypothetical protein